MAPTVRELEVKLSKRDLDPRRRAEAAVELGRHGKDAEKAVPALLQALGQEDYGLRCGAAEALGHIGDPLAVPQLMKMLKDKLAVVRIAAAMALGSIGRKAEDAVPLLGEALSDDVVLVKYVAADALAKIGPNASGAVEQVAAAVRDKDLGVADKAQWALTCIGAKAVPLLLEMLKDENEDIRRRTMDMLGGIGQFAQSEKTAAKTEKNQKDGFKAALEKEDSLMAAVPALREASTSTEPPLILVLAALQALGNIGPKAVEASLPELRAAMEHQDSSVRTIASRAIGGIGADAAKAALPGLMKAVKDENHEVRIAAIQSLEKLGPAATPAVPLLCEAIQHDWMPPVKAVAAGACGTLGPTVASDAIPMIKELLKHPEEWMQNVAKDSLRKLRGRMMRWCSSITDSCSVM